MKNYKFMFPDEKNKFRVIEIKVNNTYALTYFNTETGKILDYCFREALVVNDGFAQVLTDKGYCYFNPETETLSEPFEATSMLRDGYGIGRKNRFKYYLYDAQKNMTIERPFRQIFDVADEMAVVLLLEEKGKCALYDIKADKLLPERFNNIRIQSKKLAAGQFTTAQLRKIYTGDLFHKPDWTLFNPTTHETHNKLFNDVSFIGKDVYVVDETKQWEWHVYPTPWENDDENR